MAHEEIEQRLREKLAELQSRLARIKADAGREHSPDSGEQAQERENDEVVDAIGDETQQSIRDVNLALRRIEDGDYGLCDSCGKAIAAARLEVLPEATRCIDCAE